MEINGVAHVMLTVSDYEACLPFYEKLLPFLGLTFVVRKTGSQFYCIGGRTGMGIHKAEEQYRGERFVQGRAGLHHVCLRARERKRRRCGLPVPAQHRRHGCPSARRGRMGLGLLLGAVRRPRRHPVRSQSHPGQGPAGRIAAHTPWGHPERALSESKDPRAVLRACSAAPPRSGDRNKRRRARSPLAGAPVSRSRERESVALSA